MQSGVMNRWRTILLIMVVTIGGTLATIATSERPAAANAGTPSWWNEKICDTNNYPGSYALGASYNGVQACGPGTYSQGGTDRLVHFYSGAWGEYEWECVELVMRYMYLVYNIAPYPANGNTVVSNYSGNVLNAISNDGNHLPSPGDIVSFAGVQANPNGHTAVITAVNITSGSGTVTIMQQNNTSNGWGTLMVSGGKITSTLLGGAVTGWLHNPNGSSSSSPPSTSNTILRAKKRSFGSAQQVWTATKHGVYVDEWYPGSGGIHHAKVYTAKADEEIVDFDKINQPDGVTQNLYIATKGTGGSHGRVWEVWWNGGGYSEPAKLFEHDGMTRVVADLQQSGSTLTHRLYVLANDGPYEYWWRAGTGVSNGYLLWNIAGGLDIIKNVGIDGKDEIFVATPSNVYSMKWPVNGDVQRKTVTQLANTVGVAVQNKGTTELLYTATKTGVHETWWNTSKPTGWFSDPAKVITVPGSETTVGIQERLYGDVQHLYLATTGNVYRYLSGSSGFGNPALVVGIDPSAVTAIDASADPANSSTRQMYIVHKSFVLERYWTGDAGTVQGGEPIVSLGQDE